MVAYRFEIQLNIDVVIEDDSENPLSKSELRVKVIDNLREYIDGAEPSDCYVSDGVELK